MLIKYLKQVIFIGNVKLFDNQNNSYFLAFRDELVKGYIAVFLTNFSLYSIILPVSQRECYMFVNSFTSTKKYVNILLMIIFRRVIYMDV